MLRLITDIHPARNKIPGTPLTQNKVFDKQFSKCYFSSTHAMKIALCFMKPAKLNTLSRRERQIMDVLYKLEQATVAEVLERLSGNPSYSTVRAQLRVLEEKGHVRHEEIGLRYVYAPIVPREVARRSALRHLVETFFDGSAEKVVAALLGGEASRMSEEELDRLARLIRKDRKESEP